MKFHLRPSLILVSLFASVPSCNREKSVGGAQQEASASSLPTLPVGPAPLTADAPPPADDQLVVGGGVSSPQGGVYRQWSEQAVPCNKPSRLAFDFRLDSDTVFNHGADNCTLSVNSESGAAGGPFSSVYLRAFGAASGALAAREWGIFNGTPGTLDEYDLGLFVPTGIFALPGVTCTFTIDIHAGIGPGETTGKTHGTYDVTLTDGTKTVTMAGNGFRSAEYTSGSYLAFSTQQNVADDALTFSLDSISVSSADGEATLDSFARENTDSTPMGSSDASGSGWVAGWQITPDLATSRTTDEAPMRSDGGAYLQVMRTGGGTGALLPWDWAMSRAITERVGKTIKNLTYGDLRSIGELDLDDRRLTDLRGIHLLPNLETLSANNNSIECLKPLESLKQLRTLRLNRNRISDLAPLANKPDLTLLELENNEIEDTSALATLAALDQLFLAGNRIVDVQPALLNPALKHLDVSHNRLVAMPDAVSAAKLVSLNMTYNLLDVKSGSDTKRILDSVRTRTRVRYVPQMDPFLDDGYLEIEIRRVLKKPWSSLAAEDFTKLLQLNLRGKGVRSLKGLENATYLKRLILGGNKIEDLGPISGLAQLESLEVDDNRISEFSPLGNLVNLRTLNLSAIPHAQISALRGMGNLTELKLRKSPIYDLEFLTHLPELRLLHLIDIPKVTDGSPLANLVHLENLRARAPFRDYGFLASLPRLKLLDVSFGNFTDTAILTNLPDLLELDISNNPVINFHGLSGVPSVLKLVVGRTGLSDLSAVTPLINLESLDLNSNQLSELTPISRLSNLQSINLAYNQISDPSPLSKLTNLQEVNLVGNLIQSPDDLPILKTGIHALWQPQQ